MESGFSSSPRAEAFPAGLRVLVVDDDLAWLKILEKMLKKCSYEVTTCGLATEALRLLRERKDGFDIVISDVNMPDMDGFKLLEHVGLEMDLPVIMMSVDGETSRVMKGVQHGACDYLLKPIRMKELRNIWQHVFRKRMHEVRDIESHEGVEDFQMFRNGNEHSDDRQSPSGGDQTSGKRRTDAEFRHDDKDLGDTTSAKRPRVVWSVDLHQKFVKAVNQIGFDKVGPKKILDMMNVPWLTRENVASHLQKYRLYLSRSQKQCDINTSAEMFNLGNSPNIARFVPESSTCMVQSLSNGTGTRFTCPANKLPAQTTRPDSLDLIDPTGIILLPLADCKRSCGTTTSANPSISPSINNHGLGSLESRINFGPSINKLPFHHLQFKHDSGLNSRLQDLGFLYHDDELHVSRRRVQAELLRPAPDIKDSPMAGMPEMKPSSNSKHIIKDIKELFDIGPKSGGLSASHAAEPFPSVAFGTKDYITRQKNTFNQQPVGSSQVPEVDSVSGSVKEDDRFGWLQGDSFSTYLGCDSLATPEILPETPIHLYGALKFDYEYPSDFTEYPVMDQGLFIA